MNNTKKIILAALFLLLGISAGSLTHKYAAIASFKASSQQTGIIILSLLPVAWLVAVVLHEVGHALVGHWQGFKFQWMVVGPFKWQQVAGKVSFRWNTNLHMAGGMVLSVPVDDQDLRHRFSAFAIGGPIASLIWAVIALGSYVQLPPIVQAQALGIVLGMSGVLSALITLLTLVPLHLGGSANDGSRALAMWRDGPASQLASILLLATGRSVAGVRPRELPIVSLEAAADLPTSLPAKLYIYYYLYLAALDAGRVAQARDYLDLCRQRLWQIPAALQSTVWLESTFFAAAYEHDMASALVFQAQAKPSALTPSDVPARAGAALARLTENAPQALLQAQVALRELPKNLDQGSCQFYADWLRETIRWAAESTARQSERPPLASTLSTGKN